MFFHCRAGDVKTGHIWQYSELSQYAAFSPCRAASVAKDALGGCAAARHQRPSGLAALPAVAAVPPQH